MEIFEFNSIARSGHHVIMHWFLKNMTGRYPTGQFQVAALGSDWVHWNDSTLNFDSCLNAFLDPGCIPYKKPTHLSVSYDDSLPLVSHFTTNGFYGNRNYKYVGEWEITKINKIIIIRDFYNTLVSRYKMFYNDPNLGVPNPRSTYNQEFIDLWKRYAKVCLKNIVPFIKFEDWVLSKSKRVELLDKFGATEVYDNTEVDGTASSFNDKKDVLNRWDPDILPDEILDLIYKDNELHYLIGALGYDFKLT
jgi:hypothetical protein